MADLASFWTGSDLTEIELACIASYLKHGDTITVYSPEPIKNLPKGAINADASLIYPSDPLVLHKKTQSPALHSDLFRYALINKTNSIWVDLDILALRSFDFPSDYVFGLETDTMLNGAVLKLPKTSPALAALSAYGPTSQGMPPIRDVSALTRLKYALRARFTDYTIDKWPWGALGPLGLTYHLGKTGEIAHAMPTSAFYHIPLQDTHRFAAPGALGLHDLPSDAWAVHLWGSKLRRVLRDDFDGKLPARSFVNQVAYAS